MITCLGIIFLRQLRTSIFTRTRIFNDGQYIEKLTRSVTKQLMTATVYRRIGLLGAHRLLGACCLLDKICLDPR